MSNKVIIVGGGAAGFFTAVNLAEIRPDLEIIILEKNSRVLEKVKVSGGGRCNVTHACFDPKELVKNYPRGQKELLGPFYQFMTGDTMEWFENRGVPLKIEADNRVFPTSNSSQTIVDCLLNSAIKAGVQIKMNQKVEGISKTEEGFLVKCVTQTYKADYLLIASGSNPSIWEMIEKLGHSIEKPVPSLFTLKISDNRIKDIPGISVPMAEVKIPGSNFRTQGPVLVTHWGLSGPAILKLSSIAATYFAENNYQLTIEVNWVSKSYEEILKFFIQLKTENAKKQIGFKSPFEEIPNRLWTKLIFSANIKNETRWAEVSGNALSELAKQICSCTFSVNGKSTFKEEFVTAGGVNLKEIDFKRFESKLQKNLFFAGEVLNIDAVTGGFNFQNAWTGGFVVAKSISEL